MERWWDGSLESNGSAGVKDFVGDAESRPSFLLYQTVGTNVHSFRTQTVTKTEARLGTECFSYILYPVSAEPRDFFQTLRIAGWQGPFSSPCSTPSFIEEASEAQ